MVSIINKKINRKSRRMRNSLQRRFWRTKTKTMEFWSSKQIEMLLNYKEMIIIEENSNNHHHIITGIMCEKLLKAHFKSHNERYINKILIGFLIFCYQRMEP
jgi:hypothetical protein